MTTDEVKVVVKRHRPAAIVGGLVGLLSLGGWITYVISTTPTTPIIQTAGAAEVVNYIADPRGLAKLTQIEQQQFLKRWRTHIMQKEHSPELKQCFDRLDDRDRKMFVNSISKYLKRAFLDDAKQFARLAAPAEKNRFIRGKLTEIRDQAFFIKQVGGAFKSDFGGPDEFREWLMKHTSAKDRSIGEPYTDALKRVAEQMKKEERAKPS